MGCHSRMSRGLLRGPGDRETQEPVMEEEKTKRNKTKQQKTRAVEVGKVAGAAPSCQTRGAPAGGSVGGEQGAVG